MAVAVRKLNDLITTIGKSVRPQKALIDSDIRLAEEAGTAQVAGLDAQKNQAFGQIEQNAQDKGMFFSGYSPSEQAGYTATSYLPALAQLQNTIAQTRNSLLGKKADLDLDVFNKAFGAREGDIERKFDWKKMTTEQKFQARQAALDRDFQSRESAADRAAAAARSGGSGTNAAEVLDADRRAIANELSQATGDDGFVSPGTYATLKNAWSSSGYTGKTFDSYFKSFRNPENKNYKLK
jgi:hypothetical protein